MTTATEKEGRVLPGDPARGGESPIIYNRPLASIANTLVLVALLSAAAPAQNPPQVAPPVKVNVLNVCAPSPEEQKDIAAALARVPDAPRFGTDFEIARGRTAAPQLPLSNWVHLRRELVPGAPITAAQYSLSVDAGGIVETLVLRAREGTDLVQVVLEDEVTSGTPAAVLAADTPATRVRLELLGKPSRTLARCPQADQAAYQPQLDRASQVLSRYRKLLNVRTTVGAELARLGVANATPPAGEASERPAASKH